MPRDTIDKELRDFALNDFSGGVNSYAPPDRIQDNQVVQAQNAYINEDGVLTRRPGITAVGSMTLVNAGENILDILASGHGDKKKVYLLTGIAAAEIRAYSYDGTLTDDGWHNTVMGFVHGHDGSMSWGRNVTIASPPVATENVYCNGAASGFTSDNIGKVTITASGVAPSSSAVSGSPPDTRYLAGALGRLWASGSTDDDRDTLYFSAYNGSDRWDVNNNDVRFWTRGGESITGIHQFRENLLFVGAERSCYLLSVDTGAILDWSVQTISSVIGCGSHRSIASVGEDLFFMDHEGNIRSLLLLAQEGGGVSSLPISLPIKDATDDILQTDIFRASGEYYDGNYWFSFKKTDSSWSLYSFNIVTKRWSGPHVIKDSAGTQLEVHAMYTGIGDVAAFPTVARDRHLYLATNDNLGTTSSIQVYELSDAGTTDPGSTAIDLDVISKAYSFGAPHQEKALDHGEVIYQGVSGTTGTFTVWARRDFGTWVQVATVEYTKANTVDKHRFSLRDLDRGTWFQFRIKSSDANTHPKVLSMTIRLRGYMIKEAG